jgi:hypothetical protein
MPIAQTSIRSGTHVIALLEENTSFGIKEAVFDANKLRIPAWDISVTLKHQPLEDQATRQNLGEHVPGTGLVHPESEMSFSTYANGIAVPILGASPVATGLSHAISACCGRNPDGSSTSIVATGSGPTTTAIMEAVAAEHAANSLIAFEVTSTGQVHVRPCGTYNGGPPADTINLLMALPAVPADGAGVEDTIYGGFTWYPDETTEFTAQGECLGKRTTDAWEFYGANGNLSIPAVSPAESQSLQFNFKCAGMLYPSAGTQTAPTPVTPIPSAGGEYLIGAHGSTVTKDLDLLGASLELGREYAIDRDANSAVGGSAWAVTNQQSRCTLTVRDNDEPPAATGDTYYYESFANKTEFQILCVFGGRTAGKLFAFYLPKCHLIEEPVHGDTDGLATMTLTFAPSHSYASERTVWIGMS